MSSGKVNLYHNSICSGYMVQVIWCRLYGAGYTELYRYQYGASYTKGYIPPPTIHGANFAHP